MRANKCVEYKHKCVVNLNLSEQTHHIYLAETVIIAKSEVKMSRVSKMVVVCAHPQQFKKSKSYKPHKATQVSIYFIKIQKFYSCNLQKHLEIILLFVTTSFLPPLQPRLTNMNSFPFTIYSAVRVDFGRKRDNFRFHNK